MEERGKSVLFLANVLVVGNRGTEEGTEYGQPAHLTLWAGTRVKREREREGEGEEFEKMI